MALKDWKKGKKTSTSQYYYSEKTENKHFSEKETLDISFVPYAWGKKVEKPYIIFIDNPTGSNPIQKSFKTKSSVLKFAKEYMRTH